MLLVLILTFSLAACGGGGAGSDDPNLGLWEAKLAEMLGIEMDVADFFEKGFTIELKTNGNCTLNVDGSRANGKWTLASSLLTEATPAFFSHFL